MSSSIISEQEGWHVSNMMFSRVFEFGDEVARSVATGPNEVRWIDETAERILKSNTYSPDFHVQELFGGVPELSFWSLVFGELAARIYRREIGNQQDQTWQIGTIWAAFGLSQFLERAAQQIRMRQNVNSSGGGAPGSN